MRVLVWCWVKEQTQLLTVVRDWGSCRTADRLYLLRRLPVDRLSLGSRDFAMYTQHTNIYSIKLFSKYTHTQNCRWITAAWGWLMALYLRIIFPVSLERKLNCLSSYLSLSPFFLSLHSLFPFLYPPSLSIMSFSALAIITVLFLPAGLFRYQSYLSFHSSLCFHSAIPVFLFTLLFSHVYFFLSLFIFLSSSCTFPRFLASLWGTKHTYLGPTWLLMHSGIWSSTFSRCFSLCSFAGICLKSWQLSHKALTDT